MLIYLINALARTDQDVIPDGLYRIKTNCLFEGLCCLMPDINRVYSDIGYYVALGSCQKADSVWILKNNTFQSLRFNGKCMQVAFGAVGEGAQIGIWPCASSGTPVWNIHKELGKDYLLSPTRDGGLNIYSYSGQASTLARFDDGGCRYSLIKEN